MRIKKEKKTRDVRVRKRYEKLENRKGGLSERENSYKVKHLRFEEAFELNNLDYFFIIGCCNSLWVDIYIYIQKFNARYYSRNSRFFKTHT